MGIAAKGADPLQGSLAAPVALDVEASLVGGMDYGLVAFLQVQGHDDGGGQAYGEAVTPSGDLPVLLKCLSASP